MKIYHGQTTNVQRLCPGEDDCDDWISGAGKTRAAKERNVCHECPAYPTKLDKGKGHRQRQMIVDSALQIRNERQSGYPRPLNRMTGLEFQTLLIIDQLTEMEEVVLKMKTSELLMAFLKVKQG